MQIESQPQSEPVKKGHEFVGITLISNADAATMTSALHLAAKELASGHEAACRARLSTDHITKQIIDALFAANEGFMAMITKNLGGDGIDRLKGFAENGQDVIIQASY